MFEPNLTEQEFCFDSQVFKEDLVREIGELSPTASEVLVSLCYNGNISRLNVIVFECKGIKVSPVKHHKYTLNGFVARKF